MLKVFEVLHSRKMLELGFQRRGSVSPVCRYGRTILSGKILYKVYESSLTVARIVVSNTIKGHFSLMRQA